MGYLDHLIYNVSVMNRLPPNNIPPLHIPIHMLYGDDGQREKIKPPEHVNPLTPSGPVLKSILLQESGLFTDNVVNIVTTRLENGRTVVGNEQSLQLALHIDKAITSTTPLASRTTSSSSQS